jgi:eukaryotic-like serine/threonine-protein kinase
VLIRKLADDNPTVPYYRDAAANVDSNLSLVLRRPGRPALARDHAERALRQLLVKAHPETLYYRAVLADSHLNRGFACRALGEPAGAATSIRQAAALLDAQTLPSGEFCFMSACAHAALGGLAGQAGSGVPAEERPSEAQRAMALLHQAVAMGYSNVDAYRNEDALDPLRDRDDLRLLMMDLAMPAEPFTPNR